MRFSKKSTTLCAFVLGATILATSAFADVMLGSGYYSLKNAAKTTMTKLTNEADSFRVDMNVSVKIDGETFAESTVKTKFDNAIQAKETSETSLERGESRKYYSYSDKDKTIHKNFEDGSYNVYEKQKNNKLDSKIIENPFENEQIMDAEKIVDAFVGSLQDIIQVEESGGKKMYLGNLPDTQIPPLVNAISSFALKYSILNEREGKRLGVPYPKSNIYVIDASGKAIENQEGIIESGIFTASVSAKDNNGIEHIYSMELSIDVKDINNTVVAAPNLDGQEVTYSKEGNEFDMKFIGKYKNDIIKIEGNSFVKYGERFIEITSVEEGNVKGRYYEVYNEGYEVDTVRSFKFASNNDESNYYTILNYIDNKGENKMGVIHRTSLQNIDVSFDVIMNEDNDGYSYPNYDNEFDSNFIRIFE